MRLEHLYRLTYVMDRMLTAKIDEASREAYYHVTFEGRCEGEIAGRVSGTNLPRRRSDGTTEPDVRAAIETDDGATILARYRGYGFHLPPDRWATSGAVWHRTGDEQHRWLNATMCAFAGEVRGDTIILDVARIVYEPFD